MNIVQPQPPPPPKFYVNMSYMLAVIVVTLCGVAGVFGILYFIPVVDTTQLILAYIGFCGIALTQLINFIKIADVKTETQATHLLVNSQMAEYKQTLRELEFMKGVTAGIVQQQEETKDAKAKSALKKEQKARSMPETAVVVPVSDASHDDVVAIPVKKTRPPRRDR